MQLPSLETLETWPLPNSKNPETRGSANLVINILFFFLAFFTVCARLYSRIKILKSFGWDDGLIIAAMFPATAFAIVGMLTATKFQWDRHIWDVDKRLVSIGAELSIVAEILFSIASNLTKLSLLALIYRIVSKGPGYLWKFIIGAMVFIIAQCSAFVLIVLFQCGKPAAYWNLTEQHQNCISETENLLVAGIINTVTDLLVVVIPIPLVYRLQLPTQQQVAIIVLFGVGILVTLAGAVRTAFLFRTTNSWDRTWLAYPVYIASSVELYVGIICASIPAAKTFFSHMFARYFPDGIGPYFHSSPNPKTVAETSTFPSRMNSLAIGNYDRRPSHRYYDGKIAAYPNQPGKVPVQVQLVAFVTLEQAQRRRVSPDSETNILQKVESAESYSAHMMPPTRPHRPNPSVLPRPPPSYRNIH